MHHQRSLIGATWRVCDSVRRRYAIWAGKHAWIATMVAWRKYARLRIMVQSFHMKVYFFNIFWDPCWKRIIMFLLQPLVCVFSIFISLSCCNLYYLKILRIVILLWLCILVIYSLILCFKRGNSTCLMFIHISSRMRWQQ